VLTVPGQMKSQNKNKNRNVTKLIGYTWAAVSNETFGPSTFPSRFSL